MSSTQTRGAAPSNRKTGPSPATRLSWRSRTSGAKARAHPGVVEPDRRLGARPSCSRGAGGRPAPGPARRPGRRRSGRRRRSPRRGRSPAAVAAAVARTWIAATRSPGDAVAPRVRNTQRRTVSSVPSARTAAIAPSRPLAGVEDELQALQGHPAPREVEQRRGGLAARPRRRGPAGGWADAGRRLDRQVAIAAVSGAGGRSDGSPPSRYGPSSVRTTIDCDGGRGEHGEQVLARPDVEVARTAADAAGRSRSPGPSSRVDASRRARAGSTPGAAPADGRGTRTVRRGRTSRPAAGGGGAGVLPPPDQRDHDHREHQRGQGPDQVPLPGGRRRPPTSRPAPRG